MAADEKGWRRVPRVRVRVRVEEVVSFIVDKGVVGVKGVP